MYNIYELYANISVIGKVHRALDQRKGILLNIDHDLDDIPVVSARRFAKDC